MRVTTEGHDVEQPVDTPAGDADKQAPQTPEGALAESLVTLRDSVEATRFAVALPGASDAIRSARGLVDQLDDYVLPRLKKLDAPLLAVVGGSTGAGKSTLVNSLVRTVVSPAGVLRPTTRSPVLVCHPDDVDWFSESHILPGLSRTTGVTGDHQTLHLTPSEALTAGLAFLDAPDIDSVVEANRDLAAQLLAAADLWLFVTTAARYADAVPWELLKTAQERGTALALVLNRVPAGADAEVTAHLREMLSDHGVKDPTLFVIPETTLDGGLLPESTVGPVQVWFTGLAASAEQRAAVIRQTLDGALTSVWPRASDLADASDAQAAAVDGLRGAARSAYAAAVARISTGIADGALLRGEVLARWQEFVGTGDLLRALENRVGRLRDRLTAALSGRPPRASQLKVALESGVSQLITSAAEQAAEDAAAAWVSRHGGSALLAAAEGDLGRNSPALAPAVERLVREWQASVLELVRTEGASKRTAARIGAYGVNASGLVVMVAVFTSTHFIPTGLEFAVAGGTTVLSQKLLEAIFGDQAVRRLADRARADLVGKVEVLLAGEEARYAAALDEVAGDPEVPTRLRASAMVAEAARKRMVDTAAAAARQKKRAASAPAKAAPAKSAPAKSAPKAAASKPPTKTTPPAAKPAEPPPTAATPATNEPETTTPAPANAAPATPEPAKADTDQPPPEATDASATSDTATSDTATGEGDAGGKPIGDAAPAGDGGTVARALLSPGPTKQAPKAPARAAAKSAPKATTKAPAKAGAKAPAKTTKKPAEPPAKEQSTAEEANR